MAGLRFLLQYFGGNLSSSWSSSDFWRVGANQRVSFKKKSRALLSEVINRFCVGLAHVSFFTHEAYKSSLLTRALERGHVIPASWIDEAVVLSDEEAIAKWQLRLASKKALKLIVVSRLVPEKGISLLLDALDRLNIASNPIVCDIVGDGSLSAECKGAEQKLLGKVQITCLGIVKYGPALFELLTEYDALVVPIVSNEQPRIVYDAFARALPVLGFDFRVWPAAYHKA